MKRTVKILIGGSDAVNGDYSRVHRYAERDGTCWWSSPKVTNAGDKAFIYIQKPHSAIIASADVLTSSRPGKQWPYEAQLGHIQLLPSPIAIAELRKMFPNWGWPRYPRKYAYVDPKRAERLLGRARLKVKAAATPAEGGGFGTPEQNRLVEKAAVRVATSKLKRLGFSVVSREKENLGYDLVATKADKILHVEVKGVSGSGIQFPITMNEKRCAKLDPLFRLFVVTDATSPRKARVTQLTGKVLLKTFKFRPISFAAAPR